MCHRPIIQQPFCLSCRFIPDQFQCFPESPVRRIVIQVSRCEEFNVIFYGDCLKASLWWLTPLFWVCHFSFSWNSPLKFFFYPSPSHRGNKNDGILTAQGNAPFLKTALWHQNYIFANCFNWHLQQDSACFRKNKNIKKIWLRQWNLLFCFTVPTGCTQFKPF